MGVKIDKDRYEQPLRPLQKFRSGVFAVIAAIRMSNMEEQWKEAKRIGEELRVVRSKQAQARSSRRES